MSKYMHYDPKEDVIMIDFTNLTITAEMVDEVLQEYIATARQIPHKVYAVACWNNTKLAPGIDDHYGQRVDEMLKYVHGIVRYAITDPFTSIAVRTQAVKHRQQGAKSHIYGSKEEALEAVRKLRENQARS